MKNVQGGFWLGVGRFASNKELCRFLLCIYVLLLLVKALNHFRLQTLSNRRCFGLIPEQKSTSTLLISGVVALGCHGPDRMVSEFMD